MTLPLLLACGAEVPAPVSSPPPTPPVQRSAREADPLDAVIAEQEDYVYNPIGKRDPFRTTLTCRDCGRPTREDYPVEAFTLRGIIWGVADPRALVEDPAGNSRVLEPGSYIGDSWGRVTRINPDSVEIVEEYTNADGDLIVLPRTLRMAG